ncbi:MAG: hypothetical protein H7239_13835 [Flavobacterium sp.]|nr:hypothetical protein [Flavobacterium sp.]
MKNIFLALFVLFFVSCSRKIENYDLYISNVNYQLNIKTGEFKIDWYKNYKDITRFSENEKKRINELIYKYHLETLSGEKYVFGKEYLLMPNFNDEFTLKKENLIKSKIYISTQVNLKESKLNKTEIDIFNFKEELFELLKENKDFQKNMDTL